MHRDFDLQVYLTKGIERIVSETVKATLKNPKESAFMLKFASVALLVQKQEKLSHRE